MRYNRRFGKVTLINFNATINRGAFLNWNSFALLEFVEGKVNPWHPHGNDRWCGRWNQEETDGELMATEEKQRKERKKEGKREWERDRMSFRGRLISLSTATTMGLPVSLYPHASLFRYFAQLPARPKIRKRHAVNQSPPSCTDNLHVWPL